MPRVIAAQPTQRRRRPENILIGIALLAGLGWIVDQAFLEPAKAQAVEKAKDRYLTTKQDGSPADLCTEAGLVKEAYTRAGDAQGAADWDSIERSDCGAIGYPQR